MKYLIFIFLIITQLLVAQGGWKKQYYLPNSESSQAACVFETPSGNLITTGLTLETINNDRCYRISVVGADASGNILWEKKYGSSKFFYYDAFGQRSFVADSNCFYISACARDSNNKVVGALIKFDFNGDTLWQKIFRNSDPLEDVIPYGVSKSVDGGFLLTGFFQHWGNNTRHTLLLKTDINGNELWRKKISKTAPDVQAGNAILQDSASKKILIVGYQYIGTASSFGSFSNILILDSLGNKLIQTTFTNYDSDPFAEIIQLKDKTFMTCGSINANSDIGIYPRCNSVVVKFDINANIIWKKTYDTLALYNRVNQLYELPNGDIMMSGILDTVKNYNIPEICKVKLFRTDKNGTIKWKKYIGSSYSNKYSEGVRSMRPAKNGGFLFAAGFAYMAEPRPYSIIKTDSMGCDTLEEWCKYVISLDVGDLYKKTGWEFEMFPNPANDYVNLNIEAPADKSFVIKISDVSGREVEELKVKASDNYKLNVSKYTTGIYFVNLIYDGNAVETKRLIISR